MMIIMMMMMMMMNIPVCFIRGCRVRCGIGGFGGFVGPLGLKSLSSPSLNVVMMRTNRTTSTKDFIVIRC